VNAIQADVILVKVFDTNPGPYYCEIRLEVRATTFVKRNSENFNQVVVDATGGIRDQIVCYGNRQLCIWSPAFTLFHRGLLTYVWKSLFSLMERFSTILKEILSQLHESQNWHVIAIINDR
jgi:hypothetical protein